MAKRRKKSSSRTKSKKSSRSTIKTVIILCMLAGLITLTYFYYFTDKRTINRTELINSIPEGFPSFGIDISHHQGEIDWEELFHEEKYDSIIQFVYCKATEGSSHVDTKWAQNRSKLLELQKPHGAYHFFSSQDQALPQAKHFLNNWKPSAGDLPPVLDVETEGFSDKLLIEGMKIWLEEVEKKSGMRPVIYTSLNFFETKFQNEFKDYKFWIAAYSRKPECIEDSRIIHWQYSESGELPGIDEQVDFNVSKITYHSY